MTWNRQPEGSGVSGAVWIAIEEEVIMAQGRLQQRKGFDGV